MNNMDQSFNPEEQTLQYYEEHAEEFVDGTKNVDMGELYKPFLELLPATGKILDAGCGSGRDTKFFIQQGFDVVAFDNSPEIVRIASARINHDVLLLSFKDSNYHNKFNGVWACASALHIPSEEMPEILSKLSDALKPGGVLYTSYKYGEGESLRGGRHFSDYNETTLEQLLEEIPGLDIQRIWKTRDLRPGREEEQWINVLLLKK